MRTSTSERFAGTVDPIEEIRLRIWARLHYAPPTERNQQWHPVVLEEMQRRDLETAR